MIEILLVIWLIGVFYHIELYNYQDIPRKKTYEDIVLIYGWPLLRLVWVVYVAVRKYRGKSFHDYFEE